MSHELVLIRPPKELPVLALPFISRVGLAMFVLEDRSLVMANL